MVFQKEYLEPWNNSCILYCLAETIGNLTVQAFKHISDRTCVKFVPRVAADTDYINVTSEFSTR